MRLRGIALLGLLFAGGARADALSDLVTVLTALEGRDPIEAHLDYEITQSRGDEGEKAEHETGRVSLDASAGADGLRVNWPRDLLETTRREALDTGDDPKRPTTRALSEVAVPDIDLVLHAAPRLRALLAQSRLERVEDTTWDERPAHLLNLTVTPRVPTRERKYVKELGAKARVWVGADGVPLAATIDTHVKGRAMLVITFESTSHERFRFARHGDRLIAVEHEQANQSTGAGEVGGLRVNARVTVR